MLLLNSVLKISKVMQSIAAVALTLIIFLTTTDVVLRIFAEPIPGAYEIIALCGGVVSAFILPITSWMKGHIIVDLLTDKFSEKSKKVLLIITRCIGIGLALLICRAFMKIGGNFLRAGEVTGTLKLPLYPIFYALSVSFVMLSIILFCEIFKIVGGKND